MRRVFTNLALGVASLALFGAACETTARVFDLRSAPLASLPNPPWLGERWLVARKDYRERLARSGQLSRYYELYEWDRFLFYRLRPSRDLELLDVLAPPELVERTRWSVHTNARGFRTGPFDDTPPSPQVKRVLALGDSSTFGWGVEAHEAYPARLEPMLEERGSLGGSAVEVLSLGVPGYSTFQGRVLLERVALPLTPSVVTWSYLANDGALTGQADRDAYERRTGPWGAMLAVLHRSEAFEALEGWIRVAQARRRNVSSDPGEPGGQGVRNVASYAEAASNARAAVAAARAADVPIVLVANCVRGPVARVLADVARAEGVGYVDGPALLDAAAQRVATRPEFARERARLVRRWGEPRLAETPRLYTFLPDGCHPNPIGHGLLAEAVAEAVVSAAERPGSR